MYILQPEVHILKWLKTPPLQQSLWDCRFKLNKMTHSPEPATEQELQAKLQEAERGIKSIKHTQEALEREAKDVFDRLHTINVLIKKGRMSGQARENLFDEVHQLRNDPEYLAWSRNYSRLVEFENQQRDAKEALQRLNAVEAPSTPLPEISLDEALKLEPPAPSTATEGKFLSHCSDFIFLGTCHAA